MRILLKYTIKSIGEKKFRSFLIIFAIALAGALFLASSRLSSSITDMYKDEMRAAYGDVDINIYPNENSPSSFINMSACEKIREQSECIIPSTITSGEYKQAGTTNIQYIRIDAYNISDYLQINKLKIREGSIDQFKDSQLILSKAGAEQLGVNVGDEIILNIMSGKRKVTVAAIAEAQGIFKSEQGSIIGIMPFDTICRYAKTNGKPTTIGIKLKKDADKTEVINTLKKLYVKYDIIDMSDSADLEEALSSITVPFMLMTFIVVFMSIFIIYSSFKVIMLEKLPAVGTFRSIGASKKTMNAVLLLEALLYGIIGGIIACILGVGCLYVLSNMMLGMFGAQDVVIKLDIPTDSFILAFVLCVGMAVLSTLVPIISVSKISLKDIILNNRPHKHRKYLRGAIMGMILIIAGFVLASLVQKDLAMVSSVVGMFLMIIGIIKILPLFVLVFAQGLEFIFKGLFGNIGSLAAKNIKKNKSVLNSITLITIGISILLAINTMTQDIQSQVLDFYKDTFKCDITGSMGDMNDQRIRWIGRNEEVEKVVKTMQGSYKIPEFDNHSIYPEAIETTKLSPELTFNFEGDEHQLLTKLQEDRNIIVTKILKKEYDLKIGDELTFKFGKTMRQYKIIGFMDTMWNNGDFALMPIKYYKLDAKQKYYDNFYATVKAGANPEEVAQKLMDGITDNWSQVFTIAYLTQMNTEQNASIMGMINIFAVLAMVIGIVGVMNNLMISFIERKQNIAMLRSIGMSKKQVFKMIFVEGIGSGLIGAIGGIGGGVLMCYIFGYILEAMQMTMEMNVIPELFGSYLIGGMLITVIGSIIPARGSSKLNIIEAIKYE